MSHERPRPAADATRTVHGGAARREPAGAATGALVTSVTKVILLKVFILFAENRAGLYRISYRTYDRRFILDTFPIAIRSDRIVIRLAIG